jgi:hypothetical protein
VASNDPKGWWRLWIKRHACIGIAANVSNIGALQITVIPNVMVAPITSLGRLGLGDAKLPGLKAGSVLLLLWAIGLSVVFLAPLAFPDWPSASFFSTSRMTEQLPVELSPATESCRGPGHQLKCCR